MIAAVAVVAAVAVTVSPAQARPASGRRRNQASAWRRIAPLLRERGRSKARGFDFEPTFRVRTGSGYLVTVATLGDSVAIIIGRGNGRLSAYLARGVATSRRLQASYGSFGHLDMHFHPSARVPETPARRHCHGRVRHPHRDGTWAGTLRFESEDREIRIDVHRARGSVRSRAPGCFLPRRHRAATASSGPFSSFSFRDAVAAGWRHGLESAEVAGLETPRGGLYVAFSQHVSGPVAILYAAIARAKPGTIAVDEALTHAEISPPAPFHGTGIYTAAPDGSVTWTGDLTVNFPGAPAFPLTGEQFEVEVKRAL
jgi:hypothetical protein